MPCNLAAVQAARIPEDISPQLLAAVLRQPQLLAAVAAEKLGEPVTVYSHGSGYVTLSTRRGFFYFSQQTINAPLGMAANAQDILRMAAVLLVQQAVIEAALVATGGQVVADEISVEGRVVRIRHQQ